MKIQTGILNLNEYMKKVIEYFNGRTGRFNYFLSLLILTVGFFYIDWFCNYNRCLVCHPIMSITWGELLLDLFTSLGGIYLCPLICIFTTIDEGFSELGSIISILLTLFGIVQTIRRCHDRQESGWRVLIPFYAFFLIFLPGKTDQGDLRNPLVINTLMNAKWLILILFLIIGAIYLENSWFIKRHKSLYSISETPLELDNSRGDFCPNCQSRNVTKIVYGYPAKRRKILVKDKKSYFYGCILPPNPQKYHCNDCKYDWGSYRKRIKNRKDDRQNL